MRVEITIAVHNAKVLAGIFNLPEIAAVATGGIDALIDGHERARRYFPFQGRCSRAARAAIASLSKRRSVRAIHSSC